MASGLSLSLPSCMPPSEHSHFQSHSLVFLKWPQRPHHWTLSFTVHALWFIIHMEARDGIVQHRTLGYMWLPSIISMNLTLFSVSHQALPHLGYLWSISVLLESPCSHALAWLPFTSELFASTPWTLSLAAPPFWHNKPKAFCMGHFSPSSHREFRIDPGPQ